MKINFNVARIFFVLISIFAFLMFLQPMAHAHENRKLVGGKYEMIVGFLNEPAFTGQMNAVKQLAFTVLYRTRAWPEKPIGRWADFGYNGDFTR